MTCHDYIHDFTQDSEKGNGTPLKKDPQERKAYNSYSENIHGRWEDAAGFRLYLTSRSKQQLRRILHSYICMCIPPVTLLHLKSLFVVSLLCISSL